MDFSQTEDQRLIAETLSRILERHHGDDLWPALGESGLIAALVPEQMGGAGGTGGDIALVFELLGRAGASIGLLDQLHAMWILGQSGSAPDIMSDAIEGKVRLTVAITEPQMTRTVTQVTATADADGGLTGRKSMVGGLDLADYAVTRVDSGWYLVPLNAGTQAPTYALMDGWRAGDLSLDGLRGTRLAGADLDDLPRAAAILALCADTYGTLQSIMALTIDYLKTRKQFGRQIGSFQALAHRVSDMAIDIEHVHSAVINLSARLEGPASERDRTVAATKSLVGRVAVALAEDAIHMHGGIGMTEEYALSGLARRAIAADARFGDWMVHRRAFADLAA